TFNTNGIVKIKNLEMPVITDFFSTGILGDGILIDQKINNGIYRFELAETGDNTGVFTGANQYIMLSQLNVFDQNTYTNLVTIGNQIKFPAIENMRVSDNLAPEVTYLDLGQDGTNTVISAKAGIKTHTGIVSFDSTTYKPGDTMVITLQDADLNVNNDLVDIYTSLTPADNLDDPQDPATDTIGKTGLAINSDGTSFG